MASILERIRKKKEEQQQLNEKEMAEVKKKVQDAVRQTDVQKEIYSMRAQQAIIKAKNAIARNDPTRKSIAMQELKLCYGVYRYMSTLNNTYRTLDAQIQMQTITRDFASVVESLSSINVAQPKLNFKELTAKALTGLKGVDLTGMESMLNELVQGTNTATAMSETEDDFLEKLVSGEATLDTPYEQVETAQAAVSRKAGPVVTEQKDTDQELLDMLNQLSAGIN